MNVIQTIKQAFTPATPTAIVSSAEPSPFICSKEAFLFIQQAFKEKARNKQITAEDILLYNIVRGKDMDRGFTPVTNPNKLANGEGVYKGERRLYESRAHLKWILESFIRSTPGPFVIQYELTREVCTKIVNVLKGE